MRSLLLSCALTASLAPQLSAQIPAQQRAAPLAPQMVPAELRSHDFGTVARSAKTEHRFPITNIYQQDMHIRSIRASCGCTTPIVETEWIKPGETGSILARFNTGTFTGQKKATLTVTIDKPVFTELQLNVQGYIRSDLVFNPVEANFGTVPEGEPKQLIVILDYAGRSDWQIQSVNSKDTFLKTSLAEVSRGNGRVQYKISIDLQGNAPAGQFQSQVILETNDRRLTKVPFPVTGEVQSLLQVQPQSLVMGDLKPGQVVEEKFVIRSVKPFKVVDVVAENVEVQFEPTVEAKPMHFLSLKMTPESNSDSSGKASLTFITDLEGDLSVKSSLSFRTITQGNGSTSKPLANAR
jgi:Protein of unknown function (DUF1573)